MKSNKDSKANIKNPKETNIQKVSSPRDKESQNQLPLAKSLEPKEQKAGTSVKDKSKNITQQAKKPKTETKNDLADKKDKVESQVKNVEMTEQKLKEIEESGLYEAFGHILRCLANKDSIEGINLFFYAAKKVETFEHKFKTQQKKKKMVESKKNIKINKRSDSACFDRDSSVNQSRFKYIVDI